MKERIVHLWRGNRRDGIEPFTRCGRAVVLTVAHLRPITGPGLEVASLFKPILPRGARWCSQCR